MKNKKQKTISRFVSPFRYPGGKTRLAVSLFRKIKKNFTDNEKIFLVEPYAGGAGASLTLLLAGKVDKIIINDLDRAIFAFWKIAISDTDYLINKILEVNITIEEWKKQKAVYDDLASEDYELAFASLFLNRTNRSGIIEAGPIGGIEQSGAWKLDARFNKDIIIDRLKKIEVHKKRIKVYNLDGIKLLKRIEKKKQMDRYFIFLDPPYYEKGKALYLNHYTNDDHERLAKFLEKSPLKWIMTYDDVFYINNLYKKMHKTKFLIQHSAYKSKKGKEVMIFADCVFKNILGMPSNT